MGVYTKAYKPMLVAPKTAVVGLTPTQRMPVPARPVRIANSRAERGESRPRTRGRLRVRDILASCAGSKSMLRALAEATVAKVPVVRKARVRVEREGVCVADTDRREGTGYNEYEAVVVRTMRVARRGLESDR